MSIKNLLEYYVTLIEKIKYYFLTGSMLIMIAMTGFNILIAMYTIQANKKTIADVKTSLRVVENAALEMKNRLFIKSEIDKDNEKDKYKTIYKNRFIKILFNE